MTRLWNSGAPVEISGGLAGTFICGSPQIFGPIPILGIVVLGALVPHLSLDFIDYFC